MIKFLNVLMKQRRQNVQLSLTYMYILYIVYFKLRQIIPAYPSSRKMSKHEILRNTIRYITILEYCLGERSIPLTDLFPQPIGVKMKLRLTQK